MQSGFTDSTLWNRQRPAEMDGHGRPKTPKSTYEVLTSLIASLGDFNQWAIPYEASQTLGNRQVSLDSVDMGLMQKRQDSRMSSTKPRDEVYRNFLNALLVI